MRSFGLFLSFCLLSAALSACGGGSGISSKPITELTEDEARSVCEDFEALQPSDEEYAQIVCRIAGIMAAEEGADCQMTIDTCLEDPPTREPTDCAAEAMEPAPDCPTITVGELRECGEAQIAQLKEGANLTCEDSADGIFDLPPECVALGEECPAFYGDSAREILLFQALDLALAEAAAR